MSASSISEYIDCSLSYKFSRIDLIRPEFKIDALEFGTVIHEVLAFNNSERKLMEKNLKLDEIIRFFEQKWKSVAEDNSNIRYKEGKNFNVLLNEGKSLLTAHYNSCSQDNFRVVAIEEPVSFIMEGIPVPIIGVVDLIEEDDSGTVVITDYKTSSKAYSEDDIEGNPQLTLYYMALKSNGYGNREILLKFDVLIKTKTPKFEQYYVTKTEMDVRRMKKKIHQVWDGISKGVYIPNDGNWKCKGCFYKSHCDEWFRR
ncbi:MAG: PD-(D/E)XK nuclease family protein [Dissulfurispiraceae bacterium]